MSTDHDKVVWLDVRVDDASAVYELHCFQHLYHMMFFITKMYHFRLFDQASSLFPVEPELGGRHPLVDLGCN